MDLNPYESPQWEPEPDPPVPAANAPSWIRTAVTLLGIGAVATVVIAAANFAVIYAVYGR